MAKHLVPFVALSLLLFGCQEEITLDVPETGPELVVEGFLSDLDFYIPEQDLDCGGGVVFPREQILLAAGLAAQFDIDSIENETDYFPYNKVRLTQSAPYFSNEATPAVSGANVRLMKDGILVETLAEDASYPGTYRITHNPVVGSSYHLEIDALGKYFTTDPETYTDVPPLISVDAVFNSEPLFDSAGYYMAINTYEKPGPGDHYRWAFYVNNEYLDDPFFVSIVSDMGIDGSCVPGIDVYGNQLEMGDTMIVFQSRISAEYYNFLFSLRQQTAFSGGPFDTPPAPIKGNVNNVTDGKKAFGYFVPAAVAVNALIVPDTVPQ